MNVDSENPLNLHFSNYPLESTSVSLKGLPVLSSDTAPVTDPVNGNLPSNPV